MPTTVSTGHFFTSFYSQINHFQFMQDLKPLWEEQRTVKEMTRLYTFSLYMWIPPQAAHNDLCILLFSLFIFVNRISNAFTPQFMGCLLTERCWFVGSRAPHNCFSQIRQHNQPNGIPRFIKLIFERTDALEATFQNRCCSKPLVHTFQWSKLGSHPKFLQNYK